MRWNQFPNGVTINDLRIGFKETMMKRLDLAEADYDELVAKCIEYAQNHGYDFIIPPQRPIKIHCRKEVKNSMRMRIDYIESFIHSGLTTFNRTVEALKDRRVWKVSAVHKTQTGDQYYAKWLVTDRPNFQAGDIIDVEMPNGDPA
jgi:hypothetical protein